MVNNHYPLLNIHLSKIAHNTREITSRCKARGISVTGVIKGCHGLEDVGQTMLTNGCMSIGSSRIVQLKNLRAKGLTSDLMLLRIPMMSELEDVCLYSDISLQSDKKTLEALNKACFKHKRTHKVVLMVDLGDLREGLWDQEALVELALWVEKNLSSLTLEGIGTNLGCYGSIKPTVDKMQNLVDLGHKVEQAIGRPLNLISGGATSSLPLVLDETMPSGINHLRIGEGILLGRDLLDYYHCDMPYMRTDAFELLVQIVEIDEKPSYPVGEIFIDAFGNRPHYQDLGIRKRAILAVGKQDIGSHEKLITTDPLMQIVGSSSDHLIVDITDALVHYEIGDLVCFHMYYQPMLYLCLSQEIQKVILKP